MHWTLHEVPGKRMRGKQPPIVVGKIEVAVPKRRAIPRKVFPTADFRATEWTMQEQTSIDAISRVNKRWVHREYKRLLYNCSASNDESKRLIKPF